MDDETKKTLVEIARAIDERSPVVFMPMVSEFILSVADLFEERDKTIRELQEKLSRTS
jgi:hypothetical protein